MEIFPQVLISGASGLVGRALRKHLQSEEVPYATLVRSAPLPGASAYRWDPYQFKFRNEMRRLNGVRAVIHLSGESLAAGRWTPQKKHRIRESRVRSTESLVTLLAHLEHKPEVLLSASAVGYYGDRGDEILTESSDAGDGFLAEVCREWEAAATAATDLGIRVLQLRFGVIFAAGGGALKKMLPAFRLGAGGRLGSGRQWMSWISLHDVLRIMDFCMNDAQLQGPVNVVAPEAVTNAEFTRALARALHRPAFASMPAVALRLVLGEMADATLLASARAIPEKLQRAGFQFDHPRIAGALRSILPA